MKRTLAAQRVQSWSLLGLKPMHRALLRRSVDSELEKRVSTMRQQQSCEWHVVEVLSSEPAAQEGLVAALARPGVLVIDRDRWLERMGNGVPRDPFHNRMPFRDDQQIRLLWNWSLYGKSDLQWCTAWTFDGLISDPESLENWVRVSVQRAVCTQSQTNPILNGIKFPSQSLADTKTE